MPQDVPHGHGDAPRAVQPWFIGGPWHGRVNTNTQFLEYIEFRIPVPIGIDLDTTYEEIYRIPADRHLYSAVTLEDVAPGVSELTVWVHHELPMNRVRESIRGMIEGTLLSRRIAEWSEQTRLAVPDRYLLPSESAMRWRPPADSAPIRSHP